MVAVKVVILVLWNCSSSFCIVFLFLWWNRIIGIRVLIDIVYRRHLDFGFLRIDCQTVLTRIVNLIWLLCLIRVPFIIAKSSLIFLIWAFDIGVLMIWNVLVHRLRCCRNRWVSVPPKSQRQRPVFLLNFSVGFLELVFVLVVLLQRLPHQLFVLFFRYLYLLLYFDEMVLESIDFHIGFCS